MPAGVALAMAAGIALAMTACSPAPTPEPTPAPTASAGRLTPTPARPPPIATPRATASATAPRPTATPGPTPQPTQPAGWQVIRPGVEFLRAPARVNDVDGVVAVTRLDPARVDFRVRYAPTAPLTVREWHAASQSDVAVNAGYYTPENTALGLLITDGRVFGQSFRGFGGMFSVRDGRPALQWLARLPYAPDRRITQAAQSFPMLVNAGRRVDGIQDEGRRSFRTFVGVDTRGRVLFGVAQLPLWTLTDLAAYLDDEPALDLVTALNLDGGGSTGLWVSGVADPLLMNSIDPVPAVIVATAK